MSLAQNHVIGECRNVEEQKVRC